jgi:hypothetical protein
MTKTREDAEDRRLRRKTAAFRLKHDVGKAVRWSAPEEREKSTSGLRSRLTRDLIARAGGGGANRDVVKTFFEWKREEGPLFPNDDPDLERLERAMTTIARLAPRLSSFEESSFPSLLPSESLSSLPFKESSSSLSLSPSEQDFLSDLLTLDDACIEASKACTAFYRRIAVDEGPEIVRPIGARR